LIVDDSENDAGLDAVTLQRTAYDVHDAMGRTHATPRRSAFRWSKELPQLLRKKAQHAGRLAS
jgi:hypothetical protein